MRLNEIENKYYCKLEEEYQDGGSFKKYHREFLKVLQKVNKDVKRSNEKRQKDKVMNEIKNFIRGKHRYLQCRAHQSESRQDHSRQNVTKSQRRT